MIETKNLILLGGGGHCEAVIDVAESAGYKILGIFDTKENVGKKIFNHEIIGVDENIPEYIDKALFVITVGQIKDPQLRIKLHHKVKDAGGNLATIIASTAYVSSYSKISEGTVIMHKALVNANATIGLSCIINTFANIEHDVVIGDFCHISTGAMVNGNCIVGSGTFLGSQSVMVNGTRITNNCIIGAGSTVRKNILKKGIYSGNPAILKIRL